MAELDAISAWAVADELESLREAAMKRGVGFVSVWDLADRARELRAYAKATAEAAEEQYRRMRNADVARNFGIGQGE